MYEIHNALKAVSRGRTLLPPEMYTKEAYARRRAHAESIELRRVEVERKERVRRNRVVREMQTLEAQLDALSELTRMKATDWSELDVTNSRGMIRKVAMIKSVSSPLVASPLATPANEEDLSLGGDPAQPRAAAAAAAAEQAPPGLSRRTTPMPGELFNSVMSEVEAERRVRGRARGGSRTSSANAGARAGQQLAGGRDSAHTQMQTDLKEMQAFARTALAGSKFGGAGGVGTEFIEGGGLRSGTGRPAKAGSSRLATERRLSQRYFNSRPIRNYAAVTMPARQVEATTTIQEKDEQEDQEEDDESEG